MRKLATRLMGVGLAVIGMRGMGFAAAPAIAQDSGVANTAEDFKSADNGNGILGSDVDIWELMHRVQSGGGGIVDEGFRRSQSRRINREAESLRARQRAILEQRAIEADAASGEAIAQ